GAFDGYQDFFFTMWLNNPPVVLEQEVVSLENNKAEFALSAQRSYSDFERRGWHEAYSLMMHHRDLFSGITPRAFWPRQEEDSTAAAATGEHAELGAPSPATTPMIPSSALPVPPSEYDQYPLAARDVRAPCF